jgi:two-component system chemotaxis sensor kinase CheA
VSVSGHEEEFRQLFAQEATSRLERLAADLLRLEEAGDDPALVDSIFRDAHTLKGAAAVVGVEDVARVAHRMEDLLEELRDGSRSATSTLVDALLGVTDGLTAMIPAMVRGDDTAAAAATLLELLASADLDTPPAGAPPVPVDTAAPESPAAPVNSGATVTPGRDVATRVPDQRPTVDNGVEETVMVPAARLDELVRLVGESAAAHLRVGRVMTDGLGVDASTIAEFREMSQVLNDLQERTMRTRMVPVATITESLHRGVRDLARALGKSVRWEVRGGQTELDRGMLQQLAQPLLHLVRNAVDHGIESPPDRVAAGKPEQASIVLHAMQLGSEVIITVTDDGRGIDLHRVREKAGQNGTDVSGMTDHEALMLIFRSGLSTAAVTTDVSGRGVGLDAVRASVTDVRGRVEVRSEPGAGTEFRLVVPITLAVLPCLLVGAGGARYAIPKHSVVVAQEGSTAVEAHAEGRAMVWVGGEPVTVSSLATTLAGAPVTDVHSGPVIVVAGGTRRHAFRVDALLGQRDVVVKGLSRLLPRTDMLAGASVEPDGSILLVLDALGTIDRARSALGAATTHPVEPEAAPTTTTTSTTTASTKRASILVVDDALTIRELERSILERAGYQVTTASDGVEALARLAEAPVDLVLTDVEMPRMGGIELTAAIRAHPTLANIAILVLTSLDSEQDRQRGLDAGADGYIVKSAFDETALLAAIDRVLGVTAVRA